MNRRRKRGLRILIVVVVLGALLSPLCDPPALVTGAYLQAVTCDQAVVACVADAPRRLSLHVSQNGDAVFEKAVDAPQLRHEFRVSGLEPAEVYDFELRDASSEVVDRGRFVTRSDRDEDRVRFAIIGDSGGQPWWIWAQRSLLFQFTSAHDWLPAASMPTAIGAALADAKPDFWIHVGDVVYPRGEQKHYRTGFFDPFAEVLRNAPVYPVLGNHDVMVGDGTAYLDNFVLPGGNDRHFSLRDGPVRFIGVDLNDHGMTAEHPELRYLRGELERTTEPWIIVINHYPVRSVYRDRPRPDLEEHYVKMCEEFGVDLLLAGHDHNYQRFGEPGELIEIVSGGGGKSLYDIKHRPEGLVVAEKAYHHCIVEVVGAKLTLRATAVDGRILDEFTIDKAELAASGKVVANAARMARLQGL